MNLSFGDILLVSSPEMTTNFKCKLIGLNSPEYLILSMPIVPGYKDKFRDGSELTLRFMSRGRIYGYKAYVLRQIFKPQPLVFVEYPFNVEIIDLRKEKRANCLIPTECHCRYGEIPATIMDLSSGGCKLRIYIKNHKKAAKLKKDETVIIPLEIFGSPLAFSGKIRNTSVEGDNLYCGIEFVDIEDEDKQRVEDFLARIEAGVFKDK